MSAVPPVVPPSALTPAQIQDQALMAYYVAQLRNHNNAIAGLSTAATDLAAHQAAVTEITNRLTAMGWTPPSS